MKFNVKHYLITCIYVHKLFIVFQTGNFIELGHQLHFLDSFYGKYYN